MDGDFCASTGRNLPKCRDDGPIEHLVQTQVLYRDCQQDCFEESLFESSQGAACRDDDFPESRLPPSPGAALPLAELNPNRESQQPGADQNGGDDCSHGRASLALRQKVIGIVNAYIKVSLCSIAHMGRADGCSLSAFLTGEDVTKLTLAPIERGVEIERVSSLTFQIL